MKKDGTTEKVISPEGGELPEFEDVPTISKDGVQKVQQEFIKKKGENDNARDELAVGPNTPVQKRRVENAIARRNRSDVIGPNFDTVDKKRVN